MRQKNMHAIVVGAVLAVLAVGFFLYMMTLAPKSNDPAALMRIVGETSGVVIGIGLVMMIIGFIGTRRPVKGPQ